MSLSDTVAQTVAAIKVAKAPTKLFTVPVQGFVGQTKKGDCLYAPHGLGKSAYPYFYQKADRSFSPAVEGSTQDSKGYAKSRSLATYMVTMDEATVSKHGVADIAIPLQAVATEAVATEAVATVTEAVADVAPAAPVKASKAKKGSKASKAK